MATRFVNSLSASQAKGPSSAEKRPRYGHCLLLTTLALLMLLIITVPAAACTTALVSAEASASGRPMIWKQRDANAPFNTVAHIQGEKYAYTALLPSQKAVKRAYAGINEVGFAIANNLSYNLRPDSLGFDTNNGEMMARALGCCRTVDDFLALLDSTPAPRIVSANFAVIDAFGGAAYIEASDTSYVRYDVPKGGYLFRTNYSLSGDEGRGKGFARYATMEELMARRAGKGLRPRRSFTPAFFMRTGRSFVNVLNGGDALCCKRSGYLYDHDFIPRSTTTSSVVIEGIGAGDRPDAGVMWCAVGNTPCSYAIPVWLAAGEEIASPVCGDAPASRLATDLRKSLSTLDWPGYSKYLDVKALRRVLKAVRKAERRELKLGRKLEKRLRVAFDASAVAEYNAGAAARFEEFKNSVL